MLRVHLIMLVVITAQRGSSVRTLLHTTDSVVVDDATSTLLQTEPARGAHRVAQCQARCYQHIANFVQNTTVDDNDPEIWKCNNKSTPDNALLLLPCEECLVFYNATQDDCTKICSLEAHNCSESCQCLHHIKVDNTLTPTTSTSLELVCKDEHDDGASLILQLNPPPISNDSMAFVVEAKHPKNEWTQVLISNSSILELRKLESGKDYQIRVTISGPNGLLMPPIEAGTFTTLEKNYVPSEVQQINDPKVRILPGSNALALNVSWNPTGDQVCCHHIRKFVQFRSSSATSMYGQSWNSDLKTHIGEDMQLFVYSCTSIGEESNAARKMYRVPQCPDMTDDTSLTTSEMLKHCIPPTVKTICSQEVQSPTDTGVGRKLVDLHLTWQISPLPRHRHAPQIKNIRIFIDKRSEDEENTTKNIPVKNDTILHYNVTIPDMDVTRNGYDVSICVENERGKLGPWRKLKRRIMKIPDMPSPRAPAPGFRTDFEGDNDECPPITFSTTTEFSQHMSEETLLDKTAVTAAKMATVAATLVLVIAGLAALIARRYAHWRRIKRHELKRMYLQEEENKRHIDKQSPTVCKKFEEYEPLQQQHKILDKLDITDVVSNTEHHLKFESLRLGAVLGEGAFGVVRCAQMRRSQSSTWQTVAVKMLKEGASVEDRRQLQREVALMKAVGRHPHIVCMLACSDPKDPAPAPYLVVEHCALGDLQNYLRHQWKRLTQLPPHETIQCSELDTHCTLELESQESDIQNTRQIFINRAYGFQQDNPEEKVEHTEMETGPLLTPAELLSIARQVAMGMEYLSTNRVVHRDLAARNVLVTSERSVKIADFGLSRDVYEQNVYHKTSDGRLPIKWMALESLLHQLYTSASDVWSFGILLWEIVTLGGNPYPGIATSRVFPLLRSGYRMERPENCSEELYDVMLSCWMTKTSERPSFSQLREKIEKMLETCSSAGPYLPLHDYSEDSTYTISDAEVSEADTEKVVNSSQPVESKSEETAVQID